MSFEEIRLQLQSHSNSKRAEFSQRYFPAEPYQKQDVFYGGTVPETRAIAKHYQGVNFSIVQKLIDSDVHEERLCALIILALNVKKYTKRADYTQLANIKDFYMRSLDSVNRWDLVDTSAHAILGDILVFNTKEYVPKIKHFQNPDNGYPTLSLLAGDGISIWPKRISIVAMFSWIRAGNLDVPISMCDFHIDNSHHYIQKAVGWVLREIGKNDREKLDNFLIAHIDTIGSTALSYALEKHTKAEKLRIKECKS